ncbi:MAG: DUF3298 and DUF4163 domain-containing protein [Anaerolineae bacterium]|jgi:hypothetical protein|nr:DUF3298 and DUF4163 domain-containing protein [Anaerolineae bacterium]
MKTAIAVLIGILIGTIGVNALQQNQCDQKFGVEDEIKGGCRLQASFTMDVAYPAWLVDHAFADTILTEVINGMRSEYGEFFTDDSLYGMSAHWSLIGGYEELWRSESIVNLVYTFSTYTGGAHPNSFYRTFTFDLENEREVMLSDLFNTDLETVLVTLVPLIQADLRTQMGEWAEGAWIEDGTGFDPLSYGNWAIDDTALYFFFPPYQVAAYAAGSFRVAIPLESMSALLAPEFAP